MTNTIYGTGSSGTGGSIGTSGYSGYFGVSGSSGTSFSSGTGGFYPKEYVNEILKDRFLDRFCFIKADYNEKSYSIQDNTDMDIIIINTGSDNYIIKQLSDFITLKRDKKITSIINVL